MGPGVAQGLGITFRGVNRQAAARRAPSPTAEMGDAEMRRGRVATSLYHRDDRPAASAHPAGIWPASPTAPGSIVSWCLM